MLQCVSLINGIVSRDLYFKGYFWNLAILGFLFPTLKKSCSRFRRSPRYACILVDISNTLILQCPDTRCQGDEINRRTQIWGHFTFRSQIWGHCPFRAHICGHYPFSCNRLMWTNLTCTLHRACKNTMNITTCPQHEHNKIITKVRTV